MVSRLSGQMRLTTLAAIINLILWSQNQIKLFIYIYNGTCHIAAIPLCQSTEGCQIVLSSIISV